MAQQDLRVNIKGDAAGLTAALNTASGKLKAFGSKMQSVGGGLTRSLTLVPTGSTSVDLIFITYYKIISFFYKFKILIMNNQE